MDGFVFVAHPLPASPIKGEVRQGARADTVHVQGVLR